MERRIKSKNKIFLKIFACVLSSILLFFSFPPYGHWYLAFVSFIPLFLISEKIWWENFIYGCLSGFIFYSLSLLWIKNVAGFIYLLLSLYLSLYWGIFLSLSFSFKKETIILLGSFIWFFLEIIISNLLTGFPWLLLGVSQYKNFHILKFAKFTGIYGISFLVIGVNLLIYSFLKRNFSYSAFFFPVFIIFLLGISKIPEKEKSKREINLLMVQPNCNFTDQTYEKFKEILLSLEPKIKKEKIEILIFPEGTIKENLTRKKKILKDLIGFSQKNKTGILIGTFTGENNSEYNSAVFIYKDRVETYNKIRLVPYGEFILGERFKFIKNTFLKIAGYHPNLRAGNEYKIFNFKNVKFSTVICYENVFSELVRKFSENGADFFIVITNDSWFGNSSGPYQHFYHNVFRAVENGRYFLQVGLTGVTGIINSDGKIEKILQKDGKNLFVEGNIFYRLRVRVKETFYSKYDIFPFFVFSLILTGVILCRN